MTKVKRQKKRKTFQYNVNRKRLHNKQITGTQSKNLKNEFNLFTSNRKNFEKNGLVFDVNHDIKLLNKQNNNCEGKSPVVLNKTDLVSQMEKTANVVDKKQTNLSKDQMEYLGYLMQKYGDNYKDMAKDRRNYLQHTCKQLKSKIKAYTRSLARQKSK